MLPPRAMLVSSYRNFQMQRFWTRFWNDTRGQDLVEYALAAGLVAVAAVAAMPTLSGIISNVFEKIGSMINSNVG
jgi:pilus assembly protein Flp/PilA